MIRKRDRFRNNCAQFEMKAHDDDVAVETRIEIVFNYTMVHNGCKTNVFVKMFA